MTPLTRGHLLKSLLFFSALIFISISYGSTKTPERAFHIVGSSAMFPFVTAVAENFSYETPHPAPIVEATGTGGGIKIFCGGQGGPYPDMVAASRPMTASEKAFCRKNRVGDILELHVGYDGIVLARPKGAGTFPLSRKILRQALGEAKKNGPKPIKKPLYWSELSPNLPHKKIKVLGPPTTSGTRQSFEHLIFEAASLKMRQDGAYMDAMEQEVFIAQKLFLEPEALGIFSYGFLMKNDHLLEPLEIDGVPPTFKTIMNQSYPLSRPLYIYLKKYKGAPRGSGAFALSFMDPKTSGAKGYLRAYGFIPLAQEKHGAVREKAFNFVSSYVK